MEKLKHVKPTKEYEKKALDYVQEFLDYNSQINGMGGLHRFLDDYDGWLKKLEEDRTIKASEERVPAETFFLIRESDDMIVGMINIRLALNEHLKKFGGHIGYSIRPTERQKGYNKINLYLGLLCCQHHGIKDVLIDCSKSNFASAKTIKALGGNLLKEEYNEEADDIIQDYVIDVDKSIEENKEIFSLYISENSLTKIK